ncbi:DeoR/GlpR family DNA-binding transcription regulator [Alcaligenaceae bacterium CGII-47]|nr:DeoR/GlpR family DNA-binding transcription regulator [Alcaligenaceae bacterium CGII-47]
MSSSKTRERQQRILNLVHKGVADVEELSRQLDVSLSTIRRDLNRLALEGRLVRTYGGAAFVNHDRREQTLNERMLMQRQQKQAIAALAAQQVQEGDTLILDAGTTTAALARVLCGRGDLHVITNNIEALTILANDPDIRITMLGGDVRKLSMGSVGPLTELALARLSADKVFLGADGIVASRGLCEASSDGNPPVYPQ